MTSSVARRRRPVRGTRIRLLADRSARADALRKASDGPAPSRSGTVSLVSFRSVVLRYWKASGRDNLPWRQTRDPYRILVSEMMLQQTQVHRVIPYYERFIQRFPTPQKLVDASLSEVLTMWNGLGYNRRAKFLHESAKLLPALLSTGRDKIVSREELKKLPGVGDYTAKAVRVFAYDAPEVLIETNVRAVFIHHFFPNGRKVSDARLFPLIAESLTKLPRGIGPRQWYAALMDYGTYLKAMHPNPSRRSRHHAVQPRFKGSLREVRGAIVKAHTSGTPLSVVEKTYKERYAEAYRSLMKDGLME